MFLWLFFCGCFFVAVFCFFVAVFVLIGFDVGPIASGGADGQWLWRLFHPKQGAKGQKKNTDKQISSKRTNQIMVANGMVAITLCSHSHMFLKSFSSSSYFFFFFLFLSPRLRPPAAALAIFPAWYKTWASKTKVNLLMFLFFFSPARKPQRLQITTTALAPFQAATSE